jgi:hypothetical protein
MSRYTDLRNPQQLLGNKPSAVLNFSLQCQMGVMVGKFVLNQLLTVCLKPQIKKGVSTALFQIQTGGRAD